MKSYEINMIVPRIMGNFFNLRWGINWIKSCRAIPWVPEGFLFRFGVIPMSGKAAKPSQEVARGKKRPFGHFRDFSLWSPSQICFRSGKSWISAMYSTIRSKLWIFGDFRFKTCSGRGLKDVFAVLPTACGKSQLAPKVCCYLHDRGFSVQKLPSQSYIIVGYS